MIKSMVFSSRSVMMCTTTS